jgi:hypothetical protein
VTLDGTRATIAVAADSLRITPRAGGAETVSLNPDGALSAAVSAFGAALLAGLRAIPSTIRDHAPTLAVVDAAYLSARTGVPEAPLTR